MTEKTPTPCAHCLGSEGLCNASPIAAGLLYQERIGLLCILPEVKNTLVQIQEKGADLSEVASGNGFLVRRCTVAGNPVNQIPCNGYRRK